MPGARRELIMNVIDTLAANFLYYDRKEDEDLPLGEIEGALTRGELREEEIVDKFRDALHRRLHEDAK